MESTETAPRKWGLEELIAKALCYRSMGDVHAVDVKGKQRWTWYLDDARKFINAYGHDLRAHGTVWDGTTWSASDEEKANG